MSMTPAEEPPCSKWPLSAPVLTLRMSAVDCSHQILALMGCLDTTASKHERVRERERERHNNKKRLKRKRGDGVDLVKSNGRTRTVLCKNGGHKLLVAPKKSSVPFATRSHPQRCLHLRPPNSTRHRDHLQCVPCSRKKGWGI